MISTLARKRRASEPISAEKCKYSKMTYVPLTKYAREIIEKSSLSNISRQALEGIVKGEKSAQGIQKAHIEEVVRFLLHQLKWYENYLDEGDKSMLECLSTQHAPKDPSATPNATKDLAVRNF